MEDMSYDGDIADGPPDDEHAFFDAPTLTVDRSGIIVNWNLAAELTYGWTFDEVTGRKVADALVPAWGRDEYRRRLTFKNGLNAEGIGRKLRFPAVDRDGRERYVELTPITRAHPSSTHFKALLHDVTDQVSAATDASWLRDAINEAAVAMCTVDEFADIQSVNPIFEALLGVSAEALVGRNLLALAPTDAEQEILTDRFEAMKRGEVLPERSSRYHRADGAVLELVASGAPIRSPEGRLRGMCLVFSDISAKVARDHEFGQRLAELQRRSLHSRALRTPNHVRPLKAGPRAQLIRETLKTALESLEVDVAWVTVQRGEFAYLEAVEGPGGDYLLPPGSTAPLATSYYRQITSGQAASVVLQDPTTHTMPTRRSGLHSYLGVPVLRGDASVAAVLCVANEESAAGLGLMVVEQLQRLASNLGRAFDEEQARAEHHAASPRLIAIEAVLGAVSARDEAAIANSAAMVELSLAVADRLGLTATEREQVECVALLHDVGKLGVPLQLLRKAGPLTEQELGLVRETPAVGERIVGNIHVLAELAPMVRSVYERWDGTGYPDGLIAEEIPIASRIAMACGAWRAMRSDRPYRRALSRDDALMELAGNADRQFDRRVVEALIAELTSARRG